MRMIALLQPGWRNIEKKHNYLELLNIPSRKEQCFRYRTPRHPERKLGFRMVCTRDLPSL